MPPEFTITNDPATDADTAIIMAGLDAHAMAVGAPTFEKTLFALHATHDGKKIGYLHGNIVWHWLYIDLLWVQPEFQKSGIGMALMLEAEQHARAQKLTGIHLTTQDWQAEGFYKKLGYEEFSRFENFPPGYQRIGLRKYLAN